MVGVENHADRLAAEGPVVGNFRKDYFKGLSCGEFAARSIYIRVGTVAPGTSGRSLERYGIDILAYIVER